MAETILKTDAASTETVKPIKNKISDATEKTVATTETVEKTTEQDIKDGQQYIREKHGDWEVRCVKGDDEKICNLYQLLYDKDGNSIAEIIMISLPKSSKAVAGITLVSPLGTLLTQPLSLRIDSGKRKHYPYSWCESTGCIVRFGLTKSELNAFKHGVKATIGISSVSNPEKKISVDISLDGITAGFNALLAQ